MTTLLTGVNDLLNRVGLIQGDSGALTTLTDSGRQVYIDLAVFVYNDLLDELFSMTNMPMPRGLSENTITLVTNDRDYALQSDVVELYWPLIDETNGLFIEEYPGGYIKMVKDQIIPGNFTGLPQFGAIRETDGELYLDRLPTATENGRQYKYRYDKDKVMSAAADTFPVTDAVYRALSNAGAELWKLYRKKEITSQVRRKALGRAARLLNPNKSRSGWVDWKPSVAGFDPMEA